MGKCRKCGQCCDVIVVCLGRDDLYRMAQNPWNEIEAKAAKFVLENWVEISRIEAYQRNGYLVHWGLQPSAHFYRCMALQDGHCSKYKERPSVCSGYPWYGGPVKTYELFYTPSCGFAIDKKRALKRLNNEMTEEARKVI